MILRLWHGCASREQAGTYERLLHHEIAPAIMDRGIEGLRDLAVLRRLGGETASDVQIATLMTFDDWDAVVAFTSGDPLASVVPPTARAVLSSFDTHSSHYELIHRHAADAA